MAEDQNRQLVAVIANATTSTEKEALLAWAAQLLALRASELTPLQKAKVTLSNRVGSASQINEL